MAPSPRQAGLWQNRRVTAYKVLCVAGARPNFVKIAPILRALRGQPGASAPLVHTGQHYDAKLSDVFFEQLGIPEAEVSLGVGSGSHARQTAQIMERFEPVLESEQPDGVLVVGDVNSTAACAMVAKKFVLKTGKRPKVIHVEAGLRSFDEDMPEEINRRVTDTLSDLLFVSEASGVENLRREGVDEGRIHLVGNVMIDTLEAMRGKMAEPRGVPDEYGLVTLHRPSNVDDPEQLSHLLGVLDQISQEIQLVFPVHPRTRSRLPALGPRWHLMDPVGYLEFLGLQARARVVLTDSGGVQEETTVLGVRCVTLRDSTERPATITDGTNVLAGTRAGTILPAFRKAMAEPPSGRRPALWDGHTAERIVAEIHRTFSP